MACRWSRYVTAAGAAGISTDGAGAGPTATTAAIITTAGINRSTIGNGTARIIVTGIIATTIGGIIITGIGDDSSDNE
jgi:hypothetical protein